MAWFGIAAIVTLLVAAVTGVARRRADFDRMIEPADDLKRADDGQQRGLADRDGTGGFV